ncbi:hypothetical protein QFZ75_007919 [Streptomyces sp. V3I8]|uniref:hypothetical protein n=1 Tax=Streptomyces sp. V3I8 TaxID=3042279 RepID=UPI002788C608|nr:hypothetical protein [Streptomyces sp. V3I8]MDQ1041417.1 hypothetical protein [Streptomyces sp. V3I8]
MGLTSVPGQVSAGPIDGYLRDDAGDGTLGLPDLSQVPYTYAPLLGEVDAGASWSVDKFRLGGFAAFKGSPDGYGALRSAGGPRGGAGIAVNPAPTGTRATSPDGSRGADYTWGPRDFAIAVRHPGTEAWAPGNIRAYVAFTQSTNSAGMRLTTAEAEGPWDAELADSAAVSLTGRVNLWDGAPHTFHVATFGQNVFLLIDEVVGIPFRAPRAYKRNANGTTNPAVFATMPTTGDYIGYDCRGADNALWSWQALQPASGDFFYYDMGATAVQTPPVTTNGLTVTSSGEAWTVSGTATASKDGVLLAASAMATFNVAHPYGILATRWGTSTTEGGLVFRRQDANNYFMVTANGLWRSVGGVLGRFQTFPTLLVPGDHVTVRNWADRVRVWINGVSVAYFLASDFPTAAGVGFRASPSGTSQWRYIAYQPMVSDPVLPTT